jgi:putative transposase
VCPVPQSLSNILVHLIYSTKNRERLINDAVREELHRYSAAIFKACDCPAILINSVEDHVHTVFALARTATISHIVEEVKTSTSKWIKSKGTEFSRFYWQAGYGGFSVSQSNLDQVLKYVANQAEHHRHKTFQEEYREFLKRHGIAFDERYVWD